ncbi:hypothetical protein SK128_018124 [Halocaridina rubra]|uniref:Uncharacterized protein n=1 Tax=Halocaridina rubra TaxID=373956 RepID=A0AAN8ZT52_HALRR
MRERWAEYFKELLNEEDDREAEIVVVGNKWRMPMIGDENDREITKEEVHLALTAMKADDVMGAGNQRAQQEEPPSSVSDVMDVTEAIFQHSQVLEIFN